MLYRVWPDGTVQEIYWTPYHWMSDDYAIIEAESEEDALNKYKETYEQTTNHSNR